MKLNSLFVLAWSSIMGAHAITSDFESSQIGWEIQGVDCDVVLTNGYALKACAEE